MSKAEGRNLPKPHHSSFPPLADSIFGASPQIASPLWKRGERGDLLLAAAQNPPRSPFTKGGPHPIFCSRTSSYHSILPAVSRRGDLGVCYEKFPARCVVGRRLHPRSARVPALREGRTTRVLPTGTRTLRLAVGRSKPRILGDSGTQSRTAGRWVIIAVEVLFRTRVNGLEQASIRSGSRSLRSHCGKVVPMIELGFLSASGGLASWRERISDWIQKRSYW